mgnify:CR=1
MAASDALVQLRLQGVRQALHIHNGYMGQKDMGRLGCAQQGMTASTWG